MKFIFAIFCLILISQSNFGQTAVLSDILCKIYPKNKINSPIIFAPKIASTKVNFIQQDSKCNISLIYFGSKKELIKYLKRRKMRNLLDDWRENSINDTICKISFSMNRTNKKLYHRKTPITIYEYDVEVLLKFNLIQKVWEVDKIRTFENFSNSN